MMRQLDLSWSSLCCPFKLFQLVIYLFMPVVSVISFVLSLLCSCIFVLFFIVAVLVPCHPAPVSSVVTLMFSALMLGRAELCSSGWLVLRTLPYCLSVTNCEVNIQTGRKELT